MSEDLLNVLQFYLDESARCASAEAYLAACTMIASAIELLLYDYAVCFKQKVKQANSYKKLYCGQGDLERLTLGQLINISKELGWISHGTDIDKAIAKINKMRKSVHPASHLILDASFTQEDYEYCKKVFLPIFVVFGITKALRMPSEVETTSGTKQSS